MDKSSTLRTLGIALLMVIGLAIFLSLSFLFYLSRIPADSDYDATPLPTREFIPPLEVQPQIVQSTWRFETIFAPQQFKFPSQRWLAVDSRGHPHLAYGGSQLNYSWFDGVFWHTEVIDARFGAGKYAHLLLDAKDQPHIVYAEGSLESFSLEYMYRNPLGWHRRTIDPAFCFGRNLDIALDAQSNLRVVYAISPSCREESIPNIYIRYASQQNGGWQIDTISQHGMYPSLAVDRAGYAHIGYRDLISGFLLEWIKRRSGDWETRTINRDFAEGRQTSILLDVEQFTHMIYLSTSAPAALLLQHTWEDQQGLHTEVLPTDAYQPDNILNPQMSALMDSSGQIHVVYTDGTPKVLRRDSDGWHTLDFPRDGTGYYSAPTLAIDIHQQLHLAYFITPEYKIGYAVQRGGEWQKSVINQGTELTLHKVALAFDQLEHLHIAFYDYKQTIHYLSQEEGGWHDEVVTQLGSMCFPRRIELLFDPRNEPHILYENGDLPVNEIHSSLGHAYKKSHEWMNEGVPVELPDQIPNWSTPAFSPQGWLALVQSQYMTTHFLYRSPTGWHTQALNDIHSIVPPLPQIIFTGQKEPSDKDNPVLPGILHFDWNANALRYINADQDVNLVVPLLAQDESPKSISLGFDAKREPVFCVYAYINRSGQISEYPFRIGYYKQGQWQTYELKDLYLPLLPNQPLDRTGSYHFADQNFNQLDHPIDYLTGSGPNWKKSIVTGYNTNPEDLILVGTALRSTGEFCLLMVDIRANTVVLGCLESLS